MGKPVAKQAPTKLNPGLDQVSGKSAIWGGLGRFGVSKGFGASYHSNLASFGASIRCVQLAGLYGESANRALTKSCGLD